MKNTIYQESKEQMYSVHKRKERGTNGSKEMRSRQEKYFDDLLNFRGDRKVNRSYLRSGENLTVTNEKEILKAFKQMRDQMEQLLTFHKIENRSCKRIRRLFNACLNNKKVPEDQRVPYKVPCKGKGDRCECMSYKEVILVNIPGKVCGRIVVERVVALM